MEILTSKFNAACDTFNTEVEAKMHLTKTTKRKMLLSITDKKVKNEVSLWKEDVILLADFLREMAANLDSRLNQ